MFGVKSWEELREKGGTVKSTENMTVAWEDLTFRTPFGKYEFYSEKAVEYGHHALPVYVEKYEGPKEYPLRCMTPHWKLSIHSQFQHTDWLMKISPNPFLDLHPDLAKQKNIKENDLVKVFNNIGTMTIPADTVIMYEGWWKGVDYSENSAVKAIPADMGNYAKGQKGIAFHDNFVNIEKA